MVSNVHELVVMRSEAPRLDRPALVVVHPSLWSRMSARDMCDLGASYGRVLSCRRMASGKNFLTMEIANH
jgi:hypothetical protein